MNPVILALEAKAQAQTPPITATQWLYQQAGITAPTNMKLGDMPRVLSFISGRIEARANTVRTEIRTSTSPYLWPFSASNAALLYADETLEERNEIAAAQMLSAVEALRAFVLGDIFTQAGDDRAAQFLGDPKVSGSKGEARLLLDSAKNDAAGALEAFGARRDSQSDSGGGNMTISTHATNPTYSPGFWPFP